MVQIADTKFEVLGKEYIVRVYDKRESDSPFANNCKIWKYSIGLSLNGEKSYIPFDFHGSIHDYRSKVKETARDFIFMAYCILSDALSFIQSPDLDMFMDEFGYDWSDKDSRKRGKETFEGCKETYLKLGMNENTLVDILNEMSDKYKL